MITLHTFGPMWNLPDPSPFVTKAEVLLKMSGVPYQTVIGHLKDSPKGKIPFIVENGVKIGDSTLIRLHLERQHGASFDAHLSSAEKGIAWAVEKMLEDNLYWAILSERWLIDANFYKGPATFFSALPAPLRMIVTPMVRRSVRRSLQAHGLGRHSRDEVVALGARAIDALANVLGNKRYLMGAHACGADAASFAFAIGMLCPHFDTELRTHAESHANLVDYCARMRKELYPVNATSLRVAA